MQFERLFDLLECEDAGFQSLHRYEFVVSVGAVSDMFRFAGEDHEFGVEIFDSTLCEQIFVEQGLAEKRESACYGENLGFIPQFALHEGFGDDKKQQSRGVQHFMGLLAEIELGKVVVEFEVIGWVAEDDVEPHVGIEATDILLADVGLRIEVAGDFHDVGVDIIAVGIVKVWYPVEKVTDSATHVEDRLGGCRLCEFDDLAAKIMWREELPQFVFLFSLGIVVVIFEVGRIEAMQPSASRIAVEDRFFGDFIFPLGDCVEDFFIEFSASFLWDTLGNDPIRHNIILILRLNKRKRDSMCCPVQVRKKQFTMG